MPKFRIVERVTMQREITVEGESLKDVKKNYENGDYDEELEQDYFDGQYDERNADIEEVN